MNTPFSANHRRGICADKLACHIYNFDPSLFDSGTANDPTNSNGAIANNGYVIARNSSDTTLTGRQWGIAPRVGLAWVPARFGDKVVLRTGSGFYYDRGELFSYLSPGFAAGEVLGGTFGVSQAPPFVDSQTCPQTDLTYYKGYVPTCIPSVANLAEPWGATLGPPPTGKASDISRCPYGLISSPPANVTEPRPARAASLSSFPPLRLSDTRPRRRFIGVCPSQTANLCGT